MALYWLDGTMPSKRPPATVELAYVDQGYTGERAEKAAKAHEIALEVVKLPEAR